MFDGLFGKSTTEDTEVVVAVEEKPKVAELVTPQAAQIVSEDGASAEYLALAERLGMGDAPAIVQQKLLNALIAEGVSRYSFSSVHEYLLGMAKKAGAIGVVWKPLRKKDGLVWAGSDEWGWNHGSARIKVVNTVYDKAVPMPVLMTVENIEKRLGSDVTAYGFLVSDFAVENGDPFLMLSSRRGCWIIERWDEPSYRDK